MTVRGKFPTTEEYVSFERKKREMKIEPFSSRTEKLIDHGNLIVYIFIAHINFHRHTSKAILIFICYLTSKR
jgi:hypothetical protein